MSRVYTNPNLLATPVRTSWQEHFSSYLEYKKAVASGQVTDGLERDKENEKLNLKFKIDNANKFLEAGGFFVGNLVDESGEFTSDAINVAYRLATTKLKVILPPKTLSDVISELTKYEDTIWMTIFMNNYDLKLVPFAQQNGVDLAKLIVKWSKAKLKGTKEKKPTNPIPAQVAGPSLEADLIDFDGFDDTANAPDLTQIYADNNANAKMIQNPVRRKAEEPIRLQPKDKTKGSQQQVTLVNIPFQKPENVPKYGTYKNIKSGQSSDVIQRVQKNEAMERLKPKQIDSKNNLRGNPTQPPKVIKIEKVVPLREKEKVVTDGLSKIATIQPSKQLSPNQISDMNEVQLREFIRMKITYYYFRAYALQKTLDALTITEAQEKLTFPSLINTARDYKQFKPNSPRYGDFVFASVLYSMMNLDESIEILKAHPYQKWVLDMAMENQYNYNLHAIGKYIIQTPQSSVSRILIEPIKDANEKLKSFEALQVPINGRTDYELMGKELMNEANFIKNNPIWKLDSIEKSKAYEKMQGALMFRSYSAVKYANVLNDAKEFLVQDSTIDIKMITHPDFIATNFLTLIALAVKWGTNMEQFKQSYAIASDPIQSTVEDANEDEDIEIPPIPVDANKLLPLPLPPPLPTSSPPIKKPSDEGVLPTINEEDLLGSDLSNLLDITDSKMELSVESEYINPDAAVPSELIDMGRFAATKLSYAFTGLFATDAVKAELQSYKKNNRLDTSTLIKAVMNPAAVKKDAPSFLDFVSNACIFSRVPWYDLARAFELLPYISSLAMQFNFKTGGVELDFRDKWEFAAKDDMKWLTEKYKKARDAIIAQQDSLKADLITSGLLDNDSKLDSFKLALNKLDDEEERLKQSLDLTTLRINQGKKYLDQSLDLLTYRTVTMTEFCSVLKLPSSNKELSVPMLIDVKKNLKITRFIIAVNLKYEANKKHTGAGALGFSKTKWDAIEEVAIAAKETASNNVTEGDLIETSAAKKDLEYIPVTFTVEVNHPFHQMLARERRLATEWSAQFNQIEFDKVQNRMDWENYRYKRQRENDDEDHDIKSVMIMHPTEQDLLALASDRAHMRLKRSNDKTNDTEETNAIVTYHEDVFDANIASKRGKINTEQDTLALANDSTGMRPIRDTEETNAIVTIPRRVRFRTDDSLIALANSFREEQNAVEELPSNVVQIYGKGLITRAKTSTSGKGISALKDEYEDEEEEDSESEEIVEGLKKAGNNSKLLIGDLSARPGIFKVIHI